MRAVRSIRTAAHGRPLATFAIAIAILALAAGCSKRHPTAPPGTGAPRTYPMGFSGILTRLDLTIAIQAIDMWSLRADVALQHDEPPWDSLLAGVPADTLVRRHELALMQYYRLVKHLKIIYEIDPTNGLDRGADSHPLVLAGRSITEPAIRALYRAWATAVDTLVHPDYLGLASETNLVRTAAPAALYNAVRTLANSTADSLHALHARRGDAAPVLYASVQVETAWGRLPPGGSYVGVATDLADFPFASVLGLSSYPYLGGFAEPEDVPADYYARIATDAGKPVMVVEGGWTSASLASAGVLSSPAKQARFFRRQAQWADAAHAIGVCQLSFTDLALSFFPPQPPGASLVLFASLGVVDSVLTPKLALAAWDSTFARPGP